MKRFVKEYANFKICSYKNTVLEENAKKRINIIVNGCKKGLITDLEAVYAIANYGKDD